MMKFSAKTENSPFQHISILICSYICSIFTLTTTYANETNVTFNRPYQAGEALLPYCVKKGGPCGLIDDQGKVLVEPRFAEIEVDDVLTDGNLQIKAKVGKSWGIFDSDGKWLTAVAFRELHFIRNGIALWAQPENGKWRWGLVSRTGGLQLSPDIVEVRDFTDDITVAKIYVKNGDKDDLRYGLIDKTGKWVVEPSDMMIDDYKEGFAAFTMSADNKTGYFDSNGRVFFEGKHNWSHSFSEGFGVIVHNSLESGMIDKEGHWVIPIRVDILRDFSEGLAASLKYDEDLENPKFGFVDTRGNYIIKPQYEDVMKFSEGKAAVESNRKWGFIDSDGNTVIKARFDYVGNFSQGMAPANIGAKQDPGTVLKFLIGGKWGVIDEKGSWIVKPKFESVQIRQGVVFAETSGTVEYYNREGHLFGQSAKPDR